MQAVELRSTDWKKTSVGGLRSRNVGQEQASVAGIQRVVGGGQRHCAQCAVMTCAIACVPALNTNTCASRNATASAMAANTRAANAPR